MKFVIVMVTDTNWDAETEVSLPFNQTSGPQLPTGLYNSPHSFFQLFLEDIIQVVLGETDRQVCMYVHEHMDTHTYHWHNACTCLRTHVCMYACTYVYICVVYVCVVFVYPSHVHTMCTCMYTCSYAHACNILFIHYVHICDHF